MSNCTYFIEYMEMSLCGPYSKCIRSKVYTVSKLFPAPCCTRRNKISGYVCSVLSPVCQSGKHASLCSPSKIRGDGRGRGAFHADFSPATDWKQHVKAGWVQPDKEPPSASRGGRILALGQLTQQKKKKKKKRAPQMSAGREQSPRETWGHGHLNEPEDLPLSSCSFINEVRLKSGNFRGLKRETVPVLTAGRTSLCSPSASFWALENSQM